jgi:YidC/Oxa1 family membrane protein insertase
MISSSLLGATMFEGFFRFISSILAWLYSLVPNVGVAIILLTIIVMAVLTPLTIKSTKSMMAMQRIQPEIKKLQSLYKGDRERLNQEMMAFYKENNINPLSGCVPVIAQAPVFILLYQVLRGLTHRFPGVGGGAGHSVGKLLTGGVVTKWNKLDQPFRPMHLDEKTKLYLDLTHRSKIKFLGIDISITPADALRSGFRIFWPFLVLMILLAAVQYYQNRQIQGRNPSAQTNSQQQMMMKFLPIMLPIFSFGFPGGLSVYYLAQNLCRVATQSYITRKFYGPNSPHLIEAKARAFEEEMLAKDRASRKEPDPKAKAAGKSAISARSEAARRKQSGSDSSNGTGGSASSGRKSGSPRSGNRRTGK